MKKWIWLILLLTISCAYKTHIETPHNKVSSHTVQTEAMSWWNSLKSEDLNYFKRISLGEVVVYLCGSRVKMKIEFEKKWPDLFPYNMTEIFAITVPNHIGQIEVWMPVKIIKGKVIIHKWAAGHELARVLWVYNDSVIERAEKY